MTENSDDLVQLVLDGDENALARLISENQRCVRAYLGRYIRNSTVVDELAADVFLVAYRGLSTFKRERPLIAWLTGIARNQALMHLRKSAQLAKHVSKSLDDLYDEACRKACESENEEALLQEERLKALAECTGKLPERHTHVLKEFYCEGRDSESIAGNIKMHGVAVRVMLMRIRNSLRKCIEASLQARDTTGGVACHE